MPSLEELDKRFVWHPFSSLENGASPLVIKSASGVYLHTEDDRRVIDAVSSWWVNLHGHAHPVIADAIHEQAKTLEHVIFAGFSHEPAIRLAENLLNILPSNQSKIFYSDDGSTAVEVALKMAIQFRFNAGLDTNNIIAIRGAYHGDTFGSMSVAERDLFTKPFRPFLFDVNFVDFPAEGHEETTFDQFQSLVQNHRHGIFIFEPLVQGAAGMRIYKPDILNRMIRLARQHGVVTIADEVFTGFGRTGKMFACDHLSEQPDIIAVSKGITGGTLPLGATSCSSQIAAGFTTADFEKTFFHGHSYTANPIACAAANASLALLQSDKCQSDIARISEKQADFARRLVNRKVASARSLGTILSIALATNDMTGYSNKVRKKIYDYFLERDILLRPLGNVIYVLPPYVITDGELATVHTAILDFIDTL